MLRKRPGVVATVLSLVLASTSPALADSIVLKNGRRFDGRIVRVNDQEVTIETRGVMLTFKRDEVASVERDNEPSKPTNPSAKLDELPVVPDGVNDDEADRLRKLETQIRDVAGRLHDARREKSDAEAENAQERARLAADRAKALEPELSKLKVTRDGIVRSAAVRREQAEKHAAAEADALRTETEAIRARGDSAALFARAKTLKDRVPPDARDPSHRPLLGVAIQALVAAAEVDLAKAPAAVDQNTKAVLFTTAADRFALASSWCEDPAAAAGLRDRALKTYADAHRSSGLRPVEIEKKVAALGAFQIDTAFVEVRLEERRWGDEVSEREAGQYRAELADGRVVYGSELPMAPDARSVRERRERSERRVAKDDPATSVKLVKVARWYDLLWDASKKRWARETPVTQSESQKLVPLLRGSQEKQDALAAALADHAKLKDAFVAKRAATLNVLWQVDAGDVDAAALDKAAADFRAAAKSLAASDDAVAAARAAVAERVKAIGALYADLDRLAKGGS
jgi:hypothetical protein